VGSGDAILIQTTAGRQVLIDGGGSPSVLSDALGRRLPLGRRRLDTLIVAGTDDEQLGALPRALERYPAAQVLWSGPTGGTRGARLLSEYLVKAKIPLVTAQTGHVLDLGEGARLSVISANKRGAVLLLEWGNFRALLPVSLDRAALEALQASSSLAPVTALLLSDGGYAPVNSPAWIAKLRPQLTLLSVAAGNPRNLPDAETLSAVEGYPLLRTDQNGWIELVTDGDRLWVEVERR
jgi:competence protein ComEC